MNYEYYIADETPTVATVRFTEGDIVHIRSVNLVSVDGETDIEATETRIGEVGLGFLNKISVGLIDTKADEHIDKQFYKIKADPSISVMPDTPAAAG